MGELPTWKLTLRESRFIVKIGFTFKDLVTRDKSYSMYTYIISHSRVERTLEYVTNFHP